MKRHNRTLALLLVLLAAAFPLAARAAGNPTVTYTGDQTAFTFSDVGDGSATDLFAGFKGVMPGDVLTQRIDVRNESGAAVRIYLRQEPVDEAHRAFLQQLRLTVTSDLGGAQLYEAPPAEQDGLAENVLLGLFYPGAKLTLTAQLTVPAELDNAFADLRGTVRWVFTVEEDDSASRIADELKEEGLIQNRLIFLIQSRLFEIEFLPGTYELSTAMNSREILGVLSGDVQEMEEEET